ncbi:hypothetical protein Tco_0513668 [Tanacetum coccineum]
MYIPHFINGHADVTEIMSALGSLGTDACAWQSSHALISSLATLCIEGQKFKAERAAKEVIATEKEKVDEELIKANDEKQAKESRSDVTSFFQSDFESLVRRFLKSGEFNCAFRDVISLAMSVDIPFFGKVSQSAESSLRVIAQLEPDPAVPFSKASSTTVSLGVRTRHRSSAPFTETFGHTSTL